MVFGLGLLALAAVGFGQPQVQRADRPAASPELVVLSHAAGDGHQQITLVDPRQRVLAVYQVDRASGALSLKSVRNVQWDLLIESFNSEKPTPREVHALTQQRP
jgi:hypothetical protein